MSASEENTESTEALLVVATEPVQLRGVRDQARKVVERAVSVDQLRGSFERFLNGLQQIVGVAPADVGDFSLQEISFQAEIDAKGDFKLLGSGFEVSGRSGVTFTLRRVNQSSITE